MAHQSRRPRNDQILRIIINPHVLWREGFNNTNKEENPNAQ